MKSVDRSSTARYGVAVVCVVIATVLRSWLHPALGDQSPFATYYMAAMVAAWYGGLWPALVAVVLGAVAAAHYFIPPHDVLVLQTTTDVLALVIYIIVGCTIALLSETLHRSQRLAEQREEALHASAEAQHFLSDSSRVLTESLDYETTLWNLTRLATPRLADYCFIDVLNEDGSIRRAAVTHADPAKAELARELLLYPADPDGTEGVARVLHTTEPEVVREVSDELLEAIAISPDHLSLLRRLSPNSFMMLPLLARGRTLGVMTFVFVKSGRRHGPDDAWLAGELASRAAMAVDNARLYQVAQEAVRVRDRFLASAAHELRTPLTPLLGYASLLLRRVKRNQAVDQRDIQALQVMGSQVIRLAKMTDLLLDLSRLQFDKLVIDPGPLDLVGLTRALVAEMEPTLSAEHSIEVTGAGEPLVVEADRLRLEQVILNLLQNAIKYSPEGGTITVCLERQADRAILQISDQGIGIPDGAFPQLFTRFYRASNVDAHHISGLGLGLFVIKEIISLHGGEVEVSSQEGKGSTFTVVLPLMARES
jgi:K+-sensing histidine kinase KdpD